MLGRSIPPETIAEVVIDATFYGGAVVSISMLGWAVSRLEVLAGWVDGAPAVVKLEIIKGVLTSLAAGAVVAGLGEHHQVPTILVFIGVFFGGLVGDRYLKPVGERFLDRVFGAFGFDDRQR